jgi:hypothetical protein
MPALQVEITSLLVALLLLMLFVGILTYLNTNCFLIIFYNYFSYIIKVLVVFKRIYIHISHNITIGMITLMESMLFSK